jgi:hypothetical protein
MKNYISNISNIMFEKTSKRKRISSYDKTGGNDDRIYIKPGETRVIANINTPGIINHIWMTHMNEGFVEETNSLRKIVLKMYWDNEVNPSVLAPLGDFFGMGHAMTRNFISQPLQMSPEDGKSLNSWWPMPFKENAKIEIVNDCNSTLILYFYVDYETYDELPKEMLHFHSIWHRELPTKGIPIESSKSHHEWCFEGNNTSGKENYTILDAEGKGHYCGCNINIHNLNLSAKWDWPGEGDDMMFIDGEQWPPNIHGTGTEDYVNLAWCPTQEYCAPYHGLILGGKDNWKGKISYYRYHIQDPIMFEKSVRATIEHGHNNNRSDDYTTTAYWYQSEPHKEFEKILSVNDRLPVDTELLIREGIIKTVSNSEKK